MEEVNYLYSIEEALWEGHLSESGWSGHFSDLTGNVNYNSFYLSWTYTGAPEDEPQFTREGDQLYFIYPKEEIQPDGSAKVEHVTASVDCGYDTGHVELN